MRSFRDWLQVAPLGWLFVWDWALMTAYALLVVPHLDPEFGSIRRRLIFALFIALTITCGVALERRRVRAAMGGVTREEWRSATMAFNHGMRTGEPDHDPSLDRAVLVLIKRRNPGGPHVWLLLGVIGVLVLVVAIAAHNVGFAILAALWIGFCGIFYPLESARWRPRAARLEAALRARSVGAHDENGVAPQDVL